MCIFIYKMEARSVIARNILIPLHWKPCFPNPLKYTEKICWALLALFYTILQSCSLSSLNGKKKSTYQMKSLQWLQKVGCLKNRATNLWSLTSWTFFCLSAPRLCTPVGAGSPPPFKELFFSSDIFSLTFLSAKPHSQHGSKELFLPGE